MDSFVIKSIVDELETWISPSIIKQIGQTDPSTLWLYIKGNREGWLIIKACDPSPRLYFTQNVPSMPFLKTSLSLALEKNILGGRLEEIRIEPLERVVGFLIKPFKAGYFLPPLLLVTELLNKNNSIVLVNMESNKILASSRGLRRGDKEVFPGEEYQPIQRLSKYNPLEIDQSQWFRLLSDFCGKTDLKEYLLHNLSGLSPALVEELIVRSGFSKKEVPLTTISIQRLWEALQEISEIYVSKKNCPMVIVYANPDKLPILSSFPLKSVSANDGEWMQFTSMNEATGFYYSVFDRIYDFRQQRKKIEGELRRAEQRYSKKLLGLEEDLNKLIGSERAKDYGDIIMAHLSLIPKGRSEITLPDLYSGGEITIPLDPAKGAIQNAQAYFKKYGKTRRGFAVVKDRKSETDGIIQRLREIRFSFIEKGDSEGLEDIESLLIQVLNLDREGKERYSSSTKKNKKKDKKLTGVRVFTINGDWTLMVGKTDKANDYLTMELAKPEDVWFHVSNAPGSHVVLKNPKRLQSIPPEILKKGAGIAAFFSKLKNENTVLVSYTNRKFLRKTKGMKPGQVLVERFKSLSVKPGLEGIQGEMKIINANKGS